jgi:hypothetical protein
MKDFYLRLYDGSKMAWNTKKDGMQEVLSPQVSILGLSQHATWHSKVSPESMLDGFAARFSVMIARNDPTRKMIDFPVWKITGTDWLSGWEKCEKQIRPCYRVTAEAEAAFLHGFRQFAVGCELPESFFRRILHSAHRIACVYHVLQAKASDEIDEADYGWALRLIRHQLHDAAQIIGEQNFGEVERICLTAEGLRQRCIERGEIFNERTLYKNIRTLNPQTARVVMRLIPENLTP